MSTQHCIVAELASSVHCPLAVLAQLDITRDQTDAVLRDQQLVSGKVVTAVHSLYMRSKLGMRGTQKVWLPWHRLTLSVSIVVFF